MLLSQAKYRLENQESRSPIQACRQGPSRTPRNNWIFDQLQLAGKQHPGSGEAMQDLEIHGYVGRPAGVT